MENSPTFSLVLQIYSDYRTLPLKRLNIIENAELFLIQKQLEIHYGPKAYIMPATSVQMFGFFDVLVTNCLCKNLYLSIPPRQFYFM